jgi:hypothetical protein
VKGTGAFLNPPVIIGNLKKNDGLLNELDGRRR